MKRITEAQIRQVIRQEITSLLNEDESNVSNIIKALNNNGFREVSLDEKAAGMLKVGNRCKMGYSYDNLSYAVVLPSQSGKCLYFYKKLDSSESSENIQILLNFQKLINLDTDPRSGGSIPVRGN